MDQSDCKVMFGSLFTDIDKQPNERINQDSCRSLCSLVVTDFVSHYPPPQSPLYPDREFWRPWPPTFNCTTSLSVIGSTGLHLFPPCPSTGMSVSSSFSTPLQVSLLSVIGKTPGLLRWSNCVSSLLYISGLFSEGKESSLPFTTNLKQRSSVEFPGGPRENPEKRPQHHPPHDRRVSRTIFSVDETEDTN